MASRPAQEALANLTARFHDFGSNAQSMAIRQLMMIARQQGIVMAFADVFLMLAIGFVLFGVLALLMRRQAAPAGAAAGHQTAGWPYRIDIVSRIVDVCRSRAAPPDIDRPIQGASPCVSSS
jgi:hypothetical protein